MSSVSQYQSSQMVQGAQVTNQAINGAIAKVLGWGPYSIRELQYDDRAFWATSIDACYRDLLPAVREKYPKDWWDFQECRAIHRDKGRDTPATWVASLYCPSDFGMLTEGECYDPELARAICLVFLEVMT